MEKIDSQIKKIIFKNLENFIIARCLNDVIIKGTVFEDPDTLTDQNIVFHGEWIKSEKYGNQFVFTSYELKVDYPIFFLTTMVKGITKKAAIEINKKFGHCFEKIIEDTPNKLLEISGIGEYKLKSIVDSYSKNKHLKLLANFLLPHGITPNAITKIHLQFQDRAIDELNKNPYILTMIKGIGFKKADNIAIKLGIKEDDINRIKASLLFGFNEFISDGHTLIKKEQILGLCSDILKTDTYEPNENLIEEGLELLIADNIMSKFLLPENQDPYRRHSMYTTTRLLSMEMYIHQFFKNHAFDKKSRPIIDHIDSFIDKEESRVGFKFNDKQKQIIRLANEGYKIIGLGGYGGSGKTTSAQSILRIYEYTCQENDIVCCALSGVAANRAKTVTGYPAYTIHSLLNYGTNGFMFNANNKLKQKVILLDEASMVDTYLFYSLLQAIDPSNTLLIIVGDPSQLQSVGAGDVYRNILDKNLCHYVILDKVYRQREDQVINLFAQSIRQSLTPNNYDDKGYEDFRFIGLYGNDSQAVQQQTINEIRSIATNHMKNIAIEYLKSKDYNNAQIESASESELIVLANRILWNMGAWKYIIDFQLITPMNKNLLGVNNLNKELQSIFNSIPNENDFIVNGKIFREKDKVIHLNNENMSVVGENIYKTIINGNLSIFDEIEEKFETRVFNGQFGVILKTQGSKVAVYYPNEKYVCMYEKSNFADGLIDHSYAISIHKSQGSQFDTVVIPSSMSHYIMLNNQLMYTAVTRAKNMLYVVGEKKAFVRACTNSQTTQRNTILSKL